MSKIVRRPKPRSMLDEIDADDKETTKRVEQLRSKAEDIGPNVFPSGDEGETVTVRVESDKYSPKQYNTIATSSFEVTTKVRAGETHADAIRRVKTVLAVLAQEDFDDKLLAFSRNYMKFAKASDS